MSELSRKGREVIAAHKAITGNIPKRAKISAAVARNNRQAPPKRKMLRKDVYLGYEVVFEPVQLETGVMGYRASVPEVAGIIARTKTKREAFALIRKQMSAAKVQRKRG